MAKTLVRVKGSPEKPAHARYKYLVTWLEGGRRRKLYFNSRKDADARALKEETRLINEGRKHGAPTDEELRAVYDAREMAGRLEKRGISGFTIQKAVDFYREHLELMQRSATVTEAIAENLEVLTSQGRSQRHIQDVRSRLGRFQKSFGKRLVASITTQDVTAWLTGIPQTGSSKNNFRRSLSLFFGFCEARGYCEQNPVARVGQFKTADNGIGILTPAQAEALLLACSHEDVGHPEIIPAVALGLFAGLRRQEIARLDWSEVNFDRGFIEVRSGKSKTAQRRLVTMSDNLRMWLEPHRQIAGKVRQSEKVFQQKLTKAREAAGIAEWPHNALRHSFASYHLAHHGSADKTALELGHTETRTLFAHYRELVTPDQAAAYWQIGLPTTKAGVVAMTKAG